MTEGQHASLLYLNRPRRILQNFFLSFKPKKSRTLKTQNSLEYFVKIEQYYAFGIKSFLLSTCNYHKLSLNCKLNIAIQEWVLSFENTICHLKFSFSLGVLEKDFPPRSLSAAAEAVSFSLSPVCKNSFTLETYSGLSFLPRKPWQHTSFLIFYQDYSLAHNA